MLERGGERVGQRCLGRDIAELDAERHDRLRDLRPDAGDGALRPEQPGRAHGLEQVLRDLSAAGLDSLPGGGAEIFAERVRRKICHDKCGTDRYLDIHRVAHRLGMRSNVTMLYGHIETVEERVDHMLRARELQTAAKAGKA